MTGRMAFLFAGQGSQYAGMGRDIYDKYPFVRELYNEAESILGYNLREICFGESELLNQTRYTQPAVMVTSYALYRAFVVETGVKPVALAGFSLGEYTALCAAGVMAFADCVRIVSFRAAEMDKATKSNPGGMAAIIAYPREKLEQLCEEIGEVSVANYNCPGQLVASGRTEAIDALRARALADGARRAIPLNVSGAFHSPLMAEASFALFKRLESFAFQKPVADVIMNCTAAPLEIDSLRELMARQIVDPVYFEDSIRRMITDYGVDGFVEFGPGKVLRGFVNRIDPAREVVSIDKLTDLESLIGGKK